MTIAQSGRDWYLSDENTMSRSNVVVERYALLASFTSSNPNIALAVTAIATISHRFSSIWCAHVCEPTYHCHLKFTCVPCTDACLYTLFSCPESALFSSSVGVLTNHESSSITPPDIMQLSCPVLFYISLLSTCKSFEAEARIVYVRGL